MKKTVTLLLALSLCVCLISCDTESSSNSDSTNNQAFVNKDWEQEYKDNGTKLYYVDNAFLLKNANTYKGKTVVTTATVDEVDGTDMKSDNNKDDFHYDYLYQFKNKNELSDISSGDEVCVAGKVDGKGSILKTVTLTNCHILAVGDISNYSKKISNERSNQSKLVKKLKSNKSKSNKAKKTKSRNSYISKCKTYGYNSIKRNPDKYKGKYIKVSGNVEQVEEGWFDGVTLLISDSNSNAWYVDYTYNDKESKILEGDKLTVYGQSDGTETYENLLGKSVTIPSLTAEYLKK